MKRFVLSAVLILAAAPLAVQAAGDAAAGKSKAMTCAACHGPDGNSTNPQWPKIAGQNEKYLLAQLKDMKSGKRKNPAMAGIVANLSEKDMEDLAAYFASLKMSGGYADKDKVDAGQKLYRGGDKDRKVPACMACHDPRGTGNPPAAYPRLAGQHVPYVVAQLKAFRSAQRNNDPNGIMRDVARFMSDEEMEDVASYVQGLH